MKLFSIIIPIYNAEQYLEKCIDSILSQKYNNLEIILINDCSNDGSGEICLRYKSKYSNIKIFNNEKNLDVAQTRNIGIHNATGQYLIFIDSDDFIVGHNVFKDLEDTVNKLKPDLILHRKIIYYSDQNTKINTSYKKIRGLTNNFQKDIKDLVYYELFEGSPWDKIINKDFILENELFFPNGKRGEDIYWSSRLVPLVKTYFFYENPFYCYRKNNPNSQINNLSGSHIFDIYELLVKSVEYNRNSSNYIQKINYSFWSVHYFVIIMHFFSIDKEKKADVLLNIKRLKPYIVENLSIRPKQIKFFLKHLPVKYLIIMFNSYRKIKQSR